MQLKCNEESTSVPRTEGAPVAFFRTASRSSQEGKPLARRAAGADAPPVRPPFRIVAFIVVGIFAGNAWADDRVDSTVTWFQERRPEGKSLTVIHPQVDLGVDLGSVVSLGAGYEADIVSGATPSIYAAPRPGDVDVVTSASDFSDTRHSGHVNLTFTGSRSSLTVAYRYGTERDYRSNAITVGGSVDLPGKNTTFGLSYTRNIDEVCDFNNGDAEPLERRPLTGQLACFSDDSKALTVSKPVRIDTLQATVTQNVTPTLALQLGLFGQITQGLQSNPYRRVRVFQVDAQESVPDIRDRGAVFLKMKLALPGIHATAALDLRGYSDTWGINSGDVGVDWNQYLGKHVLVRVRGRFYQQSSASFFKTATDYELTGPAGQYFTGDREHSAVRDLLAGGKLAYIVSADENGAVLGIFNDVDIHLNAEAIWYQELVPGSPGAYAAGAFPDAIITELGILLRY